MAKTRRTFRRAMTRRPKGDWVYRHNAIRTDGGIDELGTYNNSVALAAGGSDGVILYDSKHYLWQGVRQGLLGGGAGPATYSLGNASRAEGQKALCLRVQGWITFAPSAWAVGNNIYTGWRVMAPEQDTGSGAVLLDNDYFMWQSSGASTVADHANSRRLNLWERRFFEVFNASESARWTLKVNAKIRVRLNANECLALYFENSPSSVGVNHWFWLRTFVVDEGSG